MLVPTGAGAGHHEPEPLMKPDLPSLFNIRRGEALPVSLAVGFFFCVLTALMMLRPAREALGMRGGLDAVRWLFVGTAVVTLLVNPVFGVLVSRFRRMQFIGATYLFFAASLAGFYLLLAWAPKPWARPADRCSTSGSACSTCSRPWCSGRSWPTASRWSRASASSA